MKILQVKKYHNGIARVKLTRALRKWTEKDNGYGYPVKSMFYFMFTDNKGYMIAERKNGYVIFNENEARFYLHKKEAERNLNIDRVMV